MRKLFLAVTAVATAMLISATPAGARDGGEITYECGFPTVKGSDCAVPPRLPKPGSKPPAFSATTPENVDKLHGAGHGSDLPPADVSKYGSEVNLIPAAPPTEMESVPSPFYVSEQSDDSTVRQGFAALLLVFVGSAYAGFSFARSRANRAITANYQKRRLDESLDNPSNWMLCALIGVALYNLIVALTA